jgi:hypothetical protein
MTQNHSERMRRLVASGLLPERAGQPVRVWAHVTLAELRALDDGSVLQQEWIGEMAIRWAARRAAASQAGSDGAAWLDGTPARAVSCDATVIPVVTGGIDPAALDKLVALCLQYAGHGPHCGPGPGPDPRERPGQPEDPPGDPGSVADSSGGSYRPADPPGGPDPAGLTDPPAPSEPRLTGYVHPAHPAPDLATAARTAAPRPGTPSTAAAPVTPLPLTAAPARLAPGRPSRPGRTQEARILAFSRSNSSGVMTPRSRRSASLASWSAELGEPATSWT